MSKQGQQTKLLLKVYFVEKKGNAPNVPQSCSIERFWALIKKAYSQRKIRPKNLRGFR